MSLIVETGSGSSTSESYLSVVAADTYHSNFGNTTWAALSEADKEIALRKATRYIDTKFNNDWFGKRANSAQSLDWPRSYVRDNDGYYLNASEMPDELLDATAILALLATTEDIYANVEANEGAMTVDEIVIGPIKIKQHFGEGQSSATNVYRLADDMLSKFVSPGGSLDRG